MTKLRSRIVRSSFAFFMALALVQADRLHAEEPGFSVESLVGTKVRLQAPTVARRPIEGTVMEIEGQSLLVSSGGIAVTVPRQAIERLEVSTGRRSQWLKGMAMGAVIGGSFGAYCGDCDQAVSHAAGLLGGAVGGMLIGGLVHGDRWSTVPVEGLRVSLSPARERGVGLSLSVSW